MATFLSLPTLVRLQIIETIAPDDIENFALCCKLVHRLAGRTLRQHKADKEMYSRFHFTLAWDVGLPSCLAAYFKLRDMSENRRLRLYPKSVVVGNSTILDQGDRAAKNTELMNEVRRISDSIFNDLDSPYMDKDEMKAWHSKIADGDVKAANSLLLTLLPNVERISVCELQGFDNEMSDMIYKISKTNEVSSLIWEKLSLVKLQELDVLSIMDDGATEQSSVLEAFMTLPSLRIIRGRHLTRKYKFNRWIYPDQYSNVTELHFRGCALAATHLTCLFKHLKALQILSYDHSRTYKKPRTDYGPGELISALCSYAKKTLTFLNYTSDEGDDIGDHRTPCARSLRSFKALKTLRISRVILIAKRAPQQLVDELPFSLEELELVDPINTMEAEQMFKGLLGMKQERFPNLRLIVFEGAVPFDDDVIAAYERMGLVLDWRDTGTNLIQKTDQAWLGGIECQRG